FPDWRAVILGWVERRGAAWIADRPAAGLSRAVLPGAPAPVRVSGRARMVELLRLLPSTHVGALRVSGRQRHDAPHVASGSQPPRLARAKNGHALAVAVLPLVAICLSDDWPRDSLVVADNRV